MEVAREFWGPLNAIANWDLGLFLVGVIEKRQ
jgi:hypothetical protein